MLHIHSFVLLAVALVFAVECKSGSMLELLLTLLFRWSCRENSVGGSTEGLFAGELSWKDEELSVRIPEGQRWLRDLQMQ